MQIGSEILPVEGSDTVDILLNDHTVIKRLLGDLTQAPDRGRRSAVLERLKEALTLHNATEENLVYPALAEIAAEKRESAHLYHETAEADVLVFQIDQLLHGGDETDFRAKAAQLRDAVFEHIEDEESKAFPALRERPEPAASQRLTQSVRQFRGALHFHPPSS